MLYDFPVPYPFAPQGWGGFQKMNGYEVLEKKQPYIGVMCW